MSLIRKGQYKELEDNPTQRNKTTKVIQKFKKQQVFERRRL